MTNRKVLIFDFDGTIADSHQKIYEILNDIASDYGIRRATKQEVEGFREKNSANILKEMGVPVYKIPQIYMRFKDEFYKNINQIKPIKGIEEVLKKIHEKEIDMHIVSSNAEKSIEEFLKINNLEYFDLIKGSLFGKDKAIKKVIKTREYLSQDVVYVGDEIRDIEAARKSGIKIAAVTWGFNTSRSLENEKPDWLLSDVGELLAI